MQAAKPVASDAVPSLGAADGVLPRRRTLWMRLPSRAHDGVAVGLVLALCTLLCAAIQSYFDPANLIAVYLVGVLYVALRRGRRAAVMTVIGSIVLFDLLFVAPRWSLKPTDPQYFFTFAVTLGVGLIVSHLAVAARHEAGAAQERARRAQALSQLALELARARARDAIAGVVEAAILRALGMHARLVLAGDDGRLRDLGESSTADLRAAQAALRERREAGAGTGVETLARRRYIPLAAAQGALGVLAVDATDHAHDNPEDQQLLRAFANQAAVALERAVFEQRSARAAVEAEVERLRSTLLAGISHDFRTPLTTIVGSATSLLEQRDAIDEAHRDALLREVLHEAQRMHALISDLLDLTRMEEGAVRLNAEWCPADELVDEARAALGARLDGHRLVVAVDEDAVVWCDPRLLGQALVNLLDNAARHTPAGTTVDVRVHVGAGAWTLVVHDRGPGVPAGEEEQVFKKFYRGQRNPESPGTGLGLAICAVVAELHGGTIGVSNRDGACFEMTLPQPSAASIRLREAE